MTGDIGSSIPVKVWTNAQGQVVQISLDSKRANAKAGVESVSASINFSGYDTPVTVVPPASGTYVTIPGKTLVNLIHPAAASKHAGQGQGLSAARPARPSQVGQAQVQARSLEAAVDLEHLAGDVGGGR